MPTREYTANDSRRTLLNSNLVLGGGTNKNQATPKMSAISKKELGLVPTMSTVFRSAQMDAADRIQAVEIAHLTTLIEPPAQQGHSTVAAEVCSSSPQQVASSERQLPTPIRAQPANLILNARGMHECHHGNVC